MKNIQMKIRDIEKWQDDYYPSKEKMKSKKPRKSDLDGAEKDVIIKSNKNKI